MIRATLQRFCYYVYFAFVARKWHEPTRRTWSRHPGQHRWLASEYPPLASPFPVYDPVSGRPFSIAARDYLTAAHEFGGENCIGPALASDGSYEQVVRPDDWQGEDSEVPVAVFTSWPAVRAAHYYVNAQQTQSMREPVAQDWIRDALAARGGGEPRFKKKPFFTLLACGEPKPLATLRRLAKKPFKKCDW